MSYYLFRLKYRRIITDWLVVFLIALCIIGLSMKSANATPGGEGDNTSCNGVGNPNSPCIGGQGGSGGNGGNGGNGGSSTNSNTNNNGNTNTNQATGGTGIGLGGNSIASVGSTVTTNTNSNSVALGTGGSAKGGNAKSDATGGTAKQDQNQRMNQGQDQGQHQTSNSDARVTGSGNGGVSNVNFDNKEAARSTNAVPVTVVQSDSCQTGFAAGGQAVAFGVSFSGTKTDENCERIKLWRELRQAGYESQALQLLMQDKRVADAFASTGGKKASVKLNEYEGREIYTNALR